MSASSVFSWLMSPFGGTYRLYDQWWLLTLLVLPLMFWLRGRRGAPVLVVPFAAAWHRPSPLPSSRGPAYLAIAGLVLLVFALARPQKVEDKREVKQQGYDLMLAIDLSGSMLSEDYRGADGEAINRLQAIKPVIQAFINRRPGDRIGLVVFAGRAYTLAPLTLDHDWLARQIERLRIGLIEDGTAIGDGLGIALTRLEQAGRDDQGHRRKGAFVVLLTDGANNRGLLTPEQATQIAKSRGVPVYTMGAGQDGLVRMPVIENNVTIGYRLTPSDLDEETLHQISDATGGKFFRVAETNAITRAFAAIDQAQKIDFQAKTYLLTTELFAWAAIPGAVLLFLGALLALPPPLPSSTPAHRGALPPPLPAAAKPAA